MNEVSRLARCLYGVRDHGTGEWRRARSDRRRRWRHGGLVAWWLGGLMAWWLGGLVAVVVHETRGWARMGAGACMRGCSARAPFNVGARMRTPSIEIEGERQWRTGEGDETPLALFARERRVYQRRSSAER